MPTSWTIAAPDGGTIAATLTLSDSGALSLIVGRAGRDVVSVLRLGIEAAHARLESGLSLVAESAREVDDVYTTLIGGRHDHHYVASEHTFRFSDGTDELGLDIRVSQQGVGFRYVVPWRGPVTVSRELTAYGLAADARAVLLPYDNGRCDYEEIHEHSRVADASRIRFGYPALFGAGDDWALITESDLDAGYAGSRLVFDGDRFDVDLPDPYVTAPSPLVTPWRTIVVGDLATIVESDLITSLAAPSKVTDVSWIAPGTAAWSWWSDEASPQDLATQRRWVDFAAEQGWPYLLVDEHWNPLWIEELATYARERGVGLFVWSHWQHLDSDIEHRESLSVWKERGVAGVKIDFTESDGQDRMRWFDSILAATAERELMIIFHGGTIPRGTERTWPHFMTAEAVKGAEWLKADREPFPPTHYLSLAFTRNVQGPMDFTPVTFSGSRRISAGFELALAVIFSSGVQHFADSIESYRARPEALDLLGRLSSTWDETRLLSGDPADHIVLARRTGAEWFVGAGTSGAGRTITIDLAFLRDGDWAAEVFQDGADDAIVVATRTAVATESIQVPVAENGGFTIHFRPVVNG